MDGMQLSGGEVVGLQVKAEGMRKMGTKRQGEVMRGISGAEWGRVLIGGGR